MGMMGVMCRSRGYTPTRAQTSHTRATTITTTAQNDLFIMHIRPLAEKRSDRPAKDEPATGRPPAGLGTAGPDPSDTYVAWIRKETRAGAAHRGYRSCQQAGAKCPMRTL